MELPNVTTVGEYGLASCDSLAAVTLGTLTEIGDYGFFETAITEMPRFTAETAIGKYAFSFTDLVSVTVPDGMTIAEGVFSECMNLETVVIGNDVTLGKYAFNVSIDNCFDVEDYDEDGEKYFYYTLATKLTSLTIGDNAVIGDNAFCNAASLESVTLGKNAQIGYMAFYNNASLKDIDLSAVKSLGDYAFSGDVYYVCIDDSMAYAAVSSEGTYIYTYHAPQIETLDLAAAESVGEYAFAYCRQLKTVKLNDNITAIPNYCFAGCSALESIDLDNITAVGDYAFIENWALPSVDLPVAETVGEYAFVYCKSLETVKLSENGTDIAEGAFSYCEKLSTVENANRMEAVGPYAFAYTAITEIDLSGAVTVADYAFLKEVYTPLKVTLGGSLAALGNNPFALCDLETFAVTEVTSFNGVDYENPVDSYEISGTVSVIDGSLYCRTDKGLELITYAGDHPADVRVAEDTVRISAMAFAGSDVQMVTLPHTTTAIGHKAFFGCENLETVVFGSYNAPILEEEFDAAYYESFEHIPGTGGFGEYTDYDGNPVSITGTGMLPYYMWNVTDSMYSNVFYGANFVDFVGYVEDKLTMVRPANGQNYDSWIYGQYFDRTIDGAMAPDDVALAAIAAIDAIPEKVAYEDKALVEAAREAYSKIATTLQQALVTNYADLISAEQRITALTPTESEPTEPSGEPGESSGMPAAVWVALAAAVGLCLFMGLKSRQRTKEEEAQSSENQQTEAEQTDGSFAVEETEE